MPLLTRGKCVFLQDGQDGVINRQMVRNSLNPKILSDDIVYF